ncbi:MAG TPA: thymidine phosphorylase, partial [Gemmataceae bacterium]|nr:thymidine phosphorylase [Gemmataceae bacterium]
MKNRADAQRLAESLVAIGQSNGVRTQALLTAMDVPLGRAVGNSLEVIECLETLKGRGPPDLETLSVALAARMLRLGCGADNDQEAESKIRAALGSGRGLEKFRDIIAQQGGDARVVDDYSRLPSAPERTTFPASRSGYVSRLDAELIGRATMVLGAGRDRVEDVIDPGVGAKMIVQTGDAVRAGDAVVELHYRDSSRLSTAMELLSKACQIADEPPAPQELILQTIA